MLSLKVDVAPEPNSVFAVLEEIGFIAPANFCIQFARMCLSRPSISMPMTHCNSQGPSKLPQHAKTPCVCCTLVQLLCDRTIVHINTPMKWHMFKLVLTWHIRECMVSDELCLAALLHIQSKTLEFLNLESLFSNLLAYEHNSSCK